MGDRIAQLRWHYEAARCFCLCKGRKHVGFAQRMAAEPENSGVELVRSARGDSLFVQSLLHAPASISFDQHEF
jgi:hypothetical protein